MVKIYIVDAFTRKIGAGNRAGVVCDTEGLSDRAMQEIATFAGYSETAFILAPQGDDHDIHVRYFTPLAEVPICGHATIAAHFLRTQLLSLSDYSLKVLTGAGVLQVDVGGSGSEAQITMTQGTVEYGKVLVAQDIHLLQEAFGISQSDLRGGLPVQIVSTGHSKVMIPLRKRTTLDSLAPNADKLVALSHRIGCNGFFPFIIDNQVSPLQTLGRMFAPAIGIFEDPVTGNANGPAGAYLYRYGLLSLQRSLTYEGHQGHKLGKVGTVYVTLEKDKDNIVIKIAGHAVIAGEKVYK